MTTLYGWGAMFDLPSPSPFVMKTDVQLQMLGVEFDRAIADLESVEKHKAPYVEDGGKIIEDSTFIRLHFERQLGKSLDERLSGEQRVTAHAVGRMLENHLTPIMAMERWLIDANFKKGPALFFMGVPEEARQQVMDEVRATMRATMGGQGIGRFSHAERMTLASADIGAVAELLGDKPYLFGEQPSSADAFTFAILASCSTRYFDMELIDLVESHPNLMAYIARMREQYFPEDRWPSMMG